MEHDMFLQFCGFLSEQILFWSSPRTLWPTNTTVPWWSSAYRRLFLSDNNSSACPCFRVAQVLPSSGHTGHSWRCSGTESCPWLCRASRAEVARRWSGVLSRVASYFFTPTSFLWMLDRSLHNSFLRWFMFVHDVLEATSQNNWFCQQIVSEHRFLRQGDQADFSNFLLSV